MAINFSGLCLGLQSASEIKFGAGQEGVQRCYHLRALADRRSDALHRFCAHIADCHVTVLSAPEDDRSARSSLQDGDAAENQGPHYTLTKFGFRNNQGA
jgi:hypothetical protein